MGVQPHGKKHGEDCAGAGGTLLEENARWDRSAVAAVKLQRNENGDDQAKAQEGAPDSGITPGVDAATPLEGEKEANDGTDEEKGSKEIDLSDLLAGSEFAVLPLGVLEKEEDGGNGAAAKREIDPMLQC